MSDPKYVTTELDAALKDYTAGIDRAVRFVTIDQVDTQPAPQCCLGLSPTDCADVPSRHCEGMQPDPRDAVIARLVEVEEALKEAVGLLTVFGDQAYTFDSDGKEFVPPEFMPAIVDHNIGDLRKARNFILKHGDKQ